jgi:hypothetical protein
MLRNMAGSAPNNNPGDFTDVGWSDRNAKQFTVYADAITKFATAQLVGFILLVTHGDCFMRNVLSGLWCAVCIGGVVNVAYLILVFLCHQVADKIPNQSITVAPALRGIRMLRYTIIVIDLLVTVFLPLAINCGWHHAQFFIDCKAT